MVKSILIKLVFALVSVGLFMAQNTPQDAGSKLVTWFEWIPDFVTAGFWAGVAAALLGSIAFDVGKMFLPVQRNLRKFKKMKALKTTYIWSEECNWEGKSDSELVEPIMWMECPHHHHMLTVAFPCRREVKSIEVDVAGSKDVIESVSSLPSNCSDDCEGHMVYLVNIQFTEPKLGERVNVKMNFSQ